MIPLRDENPTELTPYITVAIILANLLIWIFLQGAGFSPTVLYDTVCRYGLVPVELTGRTAGYAGVQLEPGVVCSFGGLRWTTLLTSLFLHGSWLHLLGNMLFLWVFGNNIEDSMGHLRFLVFYLMTGVVAGGAHILAEPSSMMPTIGASGAVSGIMGAYLLLYPRVRVQTLVWILIFIWIVAIPAWVWIIGYFAFQLLIGLSTPVAEGGVAHWAHIGGFLAGLILVKAFENKTLVRAKRQHVKLSPWEIENRGWW